MSLMALLVILTVNYNVQWCVYLEVLFFVCFVCLLAFHSDIN